MIQTLQEFKFLTRQRTMSAAGRRASQKKQGCVLIMWQGEGMVYQGDKT
jgi:hypothetical protein